MKYESLVIDSSICSQIYENIFKILFSFSQRAIDRASTKETYCNLFAIYELRMLK